MYDTGDFLREARQELSEYDRHASRFESLLQENRERRNGLAERLDSALAQLGASAFPAPDSAAVDSLARQLSLPDLRAAFESIGHRQAQIEARIQEIVSSPIWQNRELRLLQIEKLLADEAPFARSARDEVDRFEHCPNFTGLVERGWGTERYPHRGIFRFLNRQFLADWRDSDAAIERLGGPDFPTLAQTYLEKTQAADDMRRSQGRLSAEADSLHALENERVALEQEKAVLPDRFRIDAGRILAQSLKNRPDAAGFLPEPDSIRRAVTAIDGIEHQIQYIDSLTGKVQEDLSTLLDRSGRLREEAGRYKQNPHRYRNKSFTREQFGKRFGRTGRYDRVYDRYNRTSTTIYNYRDYDRVYYVDSGPSVGDLLWWDVITDGRLDGNFIPEVSEWRSEHPEYAYDRDQFASSGSSVDSGNFDLRDDS